MTSTNICVKPFEWAKKG